MPISASAHYCPVCLMVFSPVHSADVWRKCLSCLVGFTTEEPMNATENDRIISYSLAEAICKRISRRKT